jgi:hypothetical protein
MLSLSFAKKIMEEINTNGQSIYDSRFVYNKYKKRLTVGSSNV